MVSSPGRPGRRADARARQPQRAPRPDAWVTLRRPRGLPRGLTCDLTDAMREAVRCDHGASSQVEMVVRTIAQTAVDNETHFCELDAVVGDGDFGYSLARGFEIVLTDWDALRVAPTPATFLKKTALVHHQPHRRHLRPALGHGLPARGRVAGGQRRVDRRADVVAMLRAAHRGHQAARAVGPRRQDASRRARPGRDELEAALAEGDAPDEALAHAAEGGPGGGGGHQEMLAKRGRASYTGERSIGSPDAGAIGVAVMFEQVARRGPRPDARAGHRVDHAEKEWRHEEVRQRPASSSCRRCSRASRWPTPTR